MLGKLKGGRRKKDCVISRSAVTLDMDYGTEGILDEIDMFFDMKMIAYSTHKHTPEKPRLRLIIFLAREVTPDEYGAVSRMLADDIGIELFDDSTYEPLQTDVLAEYLKRWGICVPGIGRQDRRAG